MKKILVALTIGMFVNNSYAISTAHSSSHPTTESHAVVTHTAITNSITASNAAHQQLIRAAQVQANNTSSMFIPEIAKGVLTCGAYHPPSNSDLLTGCSVYKGTFEPDGVISIDDYFKLHKPEEATHITMVIYNSTDHEFEIYYS